MKILVLGGNGMLGHKIAQRFKNHFETFATFRESVAPFNGLEIFRGVHLIEKIDAERIESVENCVKKIKPDVLINAIGVIKQLPISKNVIKTLTINSIFPHQLVELGQKYGFRLITISTDCVFNGKKGDYTEEDPADADDLYGKSKNLGEVSGDNCLTIRTSIIGRELFTRHSLLEWFLSNRSGRVKGFVKAIYTGFPTIVLADILEKIIIKHPDLNGLFHVSSERISKFDLLNLIDREFMTNVEIEPEPDFVLDRSLDSTKFRNATGFQPENWEEMIRKLAEDSEGYKII